MSYRIKGSMRFGFGLEFMVYTGLWDLIGFSVIECLWRPF